MPVADGDGLEHHRAAGGKCLDLLEHGTVPAHHLGVPDESCQAYKQLTFPKETKGLFSLLHKFKSKMHVRTLSQHQRLFFF